MRKMTLFALVLLSLGLLTGCATPSAVIANSDQLCKDWRHLTVSKRDKLTDKTAAGMEASNHSRENWGCKLGENAAKG